MPVPKVKKGRVSLHGGYPVAFFRYDPQLVKVIRELPGAKWLPAIQGWRVSPSALDILNEMGFSVPLEMLPHQNESQVKLDGFKAKLFPYQLDGVKFALEKNRVLIADEMGLGKTIQALAYFQERKDLRPAVVVCPASLKINWLRECQKFLEDCPENKAVVLSGRKPKKLKSEAGIYIINYDILSSWVPTLKFLKPKVVVGDEAHYIKNSGRARSKAFKKICKNAESIILLTGTPIMNRPIEIYPLVNLLAPHEFSNYISFGKRYCAGHRKKIIARGGIERLVWDFTGQSNLGELNQRLCNTVMIRRLKKDVLDDLPPKRYAVLPIEMSCPDVYIKAERNFIAWLAEKVREGVFDNKRLKAALKAETLVKIGYLKQIAAYGKLKMTVEWIREFLESGEKLVLFAHHRKVIETIAKCFPDCAVVYGKTENKMKEVDRFQNDPNCGLFVGSIMSAGVGLTLTSASNVAILEFPWRPADMDQAVDRCHRIGQKSSVTAWCLVANIDGAETIDERIFKVLLKKKETANAILDGTLSTWDGNLFGDVLSTFGGKFS